MLRIAMRMTAAVANPAIIAIFFKFARLLGDSAIEENPRDSNSKRCAPWVTDCGRSVAGGETVELSGRSVNPAEGCPGTRLTMPCAFKTSRKTLPHEES